jgi:hypothetical protein
MKATFYIVLLSVVFLTACGTTPPTTEAEVPQAVESAATWTPEATKTVQTTETKNPTKTLVSMLTPTAALAVDKDQVIATGTALAEHNIYATLRAPFTECSYVNEFSNSPNNYWTAAECEPDIFLHGQNGEMIKIAPESFSAFFPTETQYMELRAQPEYWTSDNKFFYFSADAYLGDGCGCFCYRDGVALFRLEISSREIAPILVHQGKGYGIFSFSFSPNGRRLAYVIDRENKLLIKDLKTGKEDSIDFSEYTEVGNLVWSPDSQKLALGIASCPDTSDPTFKLGVIKLGKDLSPQILLAKTGEVDWENYYWHITSWQDDNTILIENHYHNTSEEVEFIDPR